MEIALIKSYTDKPWRSQETYQLIEDSLKEKWCVRTIITEKPETLYNFLAKMRHEIEESLFVFNLAEYLDENKKEGFLPALLDEWHIPHLGSSAKVVAIGLDKIKTKELLNENHIPSPQYFVAKNGDLNFKSHAKKIGYPLFVKPIYEGGHIGIWDDSIVYDYAGLERAINRIFNDFHQPALVEQYIHGDGMREFSVGIIDGDTRIFTPIEIDYEDMDVKTTILSHKGAINDLERIKLVQDNVIRDKIIDFAEKTFVTIGACDYSRVDLRMDHTGLYVLEINVMPGLGPHSFLPEAAETIHGLKYSQLIQKLAEESMKRNKK